jgi:hypothetical protein
VPLFTADGAELLWSSTGGGGWAVLAASLDPATGTTGAPTIVSPDPHTQRAPLPVALPDGGTLLLLRSNRAIVRAAGVVGDPDKARLLDPRYSGTTTVRSADTAKRALAGQFEDFQTYTYTGGPPGDGPTSRYTQHTIGVFLDPPGDSGGGGVSGADGERALALQRVTDALNDFLPLTTRAVLDTT